MICIDRLGFWSLISIYLSGEKHVLILDDFKKYSISYRVLKLTRINIEQVKFFAGDLKSLGGECVVFNALKIANQESIKIAKQHIESLSYKNSLFKLISRDALTIHYAKKILPEINRVILTTEIVESLGLKSKTFIRSSFIINSKDINEIVKFKNIEIYKDITYFTYQFIEIAAILLYKGYLQFFLKKNEIDYFDDTSSFNKSVLTLKTNTLRLDKSYRGQPYWRSSKGNLSSTPIIVLNEGGRKSPTQEKKFIEHNIFQVDSFCLGKIYRKFINNIYIREIRLERFKFFRNLRFNKLYLFLRCMVALRGIELIASAILEFKVKVFVNEEPYLDNADYIEMVAKSIGVKTVGYQYSNLGNCSTPMISTSDYFLVFSKIYSKIFFNNGIGPKMIISNGYPYDYQHKKIIERSEALRLRLNRSGAKFIICYFDERVDHNKWGVIDNGSHYKELTELIKFVCENDDIGLIIKSQFYRYSPSNWYPSDPLIKNALSTGRYEEIILGESGKRNDVFPSEAAYASDLCISQKFGGTAALESALCGKRVALLNSKPYITEFDFLYERANITRTNINGIINSIKLMRVAKAGEKNFDFGDWSNIISYFNDKKDSNAYLRIEEKIFDLLCQ